MTKIENIDELLEYIEANFEQLDQTKLCEIVSQSIGFFIRRPDTFKEAKHEIMKYWNRWKDTPFQDRPFFEAGENE
jgi:hypothetical protein